MPHAGRAAAAPLPIGHLDKPAVRALAAQLGLPTAHKPDSQDVCFVLQGTGAGARERFLSERLELHPATVVDHTSGEVLGEVPAVELVTVGQRRGLNVGGAERRFAVRIDVGRRLIEVGNEADLMADGVVLGERTWARAPLPAGSEVMAQSSAHGRPAKAVLAGDGLLFGERRRRVAPGQTVALYVGDEVVGSGIVRPGDVGAAA